MPKEKLPDGVDVIAQHKGWMDEAGIKVWLEKVWSKRPGGLLQKKALLVWDQFSSHRTDKTKTSKNNEHNISCNSWWSYFSAAATRCEHQLTIQE